MSKGHTMTWTLTRRGLVLGLLGASMESMALGNSSSITRLQSNGLTFPTFLRAQRGGVRFYCSMVSHRNLLLGTPSLRTWLRTATTW